MIATHLIAAAAIALAATCGSDDHSGSPSTTATVATETAVIATSSSLATTATSTAPSGSAPANDGSTTTTSVAVMTTLVPLTLDQTEVAEALAEAFTVSVEALEDPTVIDAVRFDAAYTVDSLFRQRLEANMQYLVENGYASRENPDVPRQFDIEDVTLLDGPPATRAQVTVCVVDTAITYEPETGGVVNDDVGAARARYDLVIEDGTWQLYEAYNMTELLYGEMQCPPAE